MLLLLYKDLILIHYHALLLCYYIYSITATAATASATASSSFEYNVYYINIHYTSCERFFNVKNAAAPKIASTSRAKKCILP